MHCNLMVSFLSLCCRASNHLLLEEVPMNYMYVYLRKVERILNLVPRERGMCMWMLALLFGPNLA